MGCGCKGGGGGSRGGTTKHKSAGTKGGMRQVHVGGKGKLSPKKMTIICERSGTTNPDDLQKH